MMYQWADLTGEMTKAENKVTPINLEKAIAENWNGCLIAPIQQRPVSRLTTYSSTSQGEIMKHAIIAVVVCFSAFAALSYFPTYGQVAKPAQQGRFALAASADGSTLWRLDTATGAASYCLTAYKNTNPYAGSTTEVVRNMSCTPWMQ